jgi:hypothetical protein
MLDDIEQQEVVDYIMANLGKRLGMAIGIHSAFEKLRSEVIKKFSMELASRLRMSLPPDDLWEVSASDILDHPIAQWTKPKLAIRNRGWDDEVVVQLRADNWGPRDWRLGITTPNGYRRAEAIRAALINDVGGRKGPEDGYPWGCGFDGTWSNWTLSDWRQPQAVLALGEGGSGSYGTYLHDRLVEIARSAVGALGTGAIGG